MHPQIRAGKDSRDDPIAQLVKMVLKKEIAHFIPGTASADALTEGPHSQIDPALDTHFERWIKREVPTNRRGLGVNTTSDG
jgi:hypothetical protein